MSEQARKIKHQAIPQWAEGLYYSKGLFSEALVYHDDEALYFEVRGKVNGVVRFSFEMLETLTEVIDEEALTLRTRDGRVRLSSAGLVLLKQGGVR